MTSPSKRPWKTYLLWTPIRKLNPGPYHRRDWRARCRRMVEGPLPQRVANPLQRYAASIRYRIPLRNIPEFYPLLPTAWFSCAEMETANRVAEELAKEDRAWMYQGDPTEGHDPSVDEHLDDACRRPVSFLTIEEDGSLTAGRPESDLYTPEDYASGRAPDSTYGEQR